ncbi:MAG TPA: hypothetical protein VIV65_07615 [Gemmatimonadaceae bacterium]|jgi:hypothetical protein
MTAWFPAGYLLLSVVILVWDVGLAARISQVSRASRPFAALTGFLALVLLPAALLRIATATFPTSRAVLSVDWVWPLVVCLIATQAVYAVARHLVNYLWGVPILVYDLLVSIVEVVRLGMAHGWSGTAHLTWIVAASSSTIAQLTTPIAATTPFFFLVPMISPAFPATRRFTGAFRGAMMAIALAWVVLIPVIGIPAGVRATGALREHAGEQLHERPRGDFAVGLKVFPDIAGIPSGAAVRNDLALADSLGVRALAIVVTPGATKKAIDSIGSIVDRLDDSTIVIVAIGYRGIVVPELRHIELNESERLATIAQVAARVHPDILLPAEDPLQVGGRIVGNIPVARWQKYYADARRVARTADPAIRIGYSVSRYSQSDSAMYAWAAASGSPVDILGFSLFPAKEGLADLTESFEKAADRWMKATPPTKPHWVFAVGAFPLNEGETTQERVIWQTLAWATGHASIKGLVVYEAGDYAQARGLRAPSGRLRPAANAVRRAIRALRESITG